MIINNIKYLFKTFLKHILFISVITIAGCASNAKNSQYQIITKFEEIDSKSLTPETLILIDIDNTILRTKTHFGSADYFYFLVKSKIKKENFTKAEAIESYYGEWEKTQSKVETKLIDRDIHKFIEKSRNAGATILALTARRPYSSSMTSKVLSKHQIKLDKLENFQYEQNHQKQCLLNRTNKSDQLSALFYDGILFVHDCTEKGDVFLDFYIHYLKYLKDNRKDKKNKIIFIDDQMVNLQSMQEAADRLGLKYYGYNIHDNFELNLEKVELEKRQLKD